MRSGIGIVIFICCITSCFFCQPIAAQESGIIRFQYFEAKDSIYITGLLQRAKLLGKSNSDSAERLNTEGLTLSTSMGFRSGILTALQQLTALYKHNQLPKAILYQKKLISLFAGKEDKKKLLTQYATLTDLYEKNSDYKLIIKLYQELLPEFKQGSVDLSGVQARLLNNVGRSYFQLGHYDSSLFYYTASLNLLKPITKSNSKEVVLAYSSLGMISDRLNQGDKALSYFRNAYQLAVTYNDTSSIISQLSNLGVVHYGRKEYAVAKKYLYQALDKQQKRGGRRITAQTYGMLAVVVLMDQPDSSAKAVQYALKSYAIAKEGGNYNDKIQAASGLGYIYQQINSYKNAEKYLLEGIELAEKRGKLDLLFLYYGRLQNVYLKMKQYEKAHIYQRMYYEYKDSAVGVNTRERMEHIELQYKGAEKDKKLAIQQSALQLQESKIREKNFWIVSVVLIAILLTVIFFMYSRNNRVNQKTSIINLHQEKEIEILRTRMDAEQAERLRIGRELHDGIVSQMLAIKLNIHAIQESDGKEINTLALAQATQQLEEATLDLRSMAHSLMPDALIQQGLTEATSLLCYKIARTGQIEVDFQVYGTMPALQDYATLSLYRMVQELIQNTLKHARARKLIVQFNYNKPSLCITVEDDGVGMSQDLLHHKEGTGVGLKTIQHRVKELRGTIEMNSKPDKATTIYMEFDDKWLV